MASGTLIALDELKPQIMKAIQETLDVANNNMHTLQEAMIEEMLRNAEAHKDDIKKLKKVLNEEHLKNEKKIREVEKQTEKLLNDLRKEGDAQIEAVCKGLEALVGADKLKGPKDSIKQYVDSILVDVLNNLHEMAKKFSKDLEDIFNEKISKANSSSHSN